MRSSLHCRQGEHQSLRSTLCSPRRTESISSSTSDGNRRQRTGPTPATAPWSSRPRWPSSMTGTSRSSWTTSSQFEKIKEKELRNFHFYIVQWTWSMCRKIWRDDILIFSLLKISNGNAYIYINIKWINLISDLKEARITRNCSLSFIIFIYFCEQRTISGSFSIVSYLSCIKQYF